MNYTWWFIGKYFEFWWRFIRIYIKVSVKHVCSMRVNFGKFLIFHLLCEVRKLWDYPDVFNVLCFLSRSKLAIFSHTVCNEVTLSEIGLSLELWSIIEKWHRGCFENFISTPKTNHNYREVTATRLEPRTT